MIDQETAARWHQAKEVFWLVVKECLVQFHGFSESEAEQKSRDLRERIEVSPKWLLMHRHQPGDVSDIFYHAEPFDIAGDIAGKHLDLSEYYPKYEIILDKFGW